MSITLYNQYIYKNGVWYLVGSSADGAEPVTYELSGSGATITLTGSDESTSSATVSGFLTTESDPTVPSWAKAASKPTYTASEVGALPDTTTIPPGTVTSVRVQATSPVSSSTSTAQTSTLNTTISLANAYGDTKNPYGTKTANYVLAGPMSGSAAAPSFRALVAADIPSITKSKISDFPSIPTKVSDLTNDSGFITGYTETDPTVPAWAKAANKPSYTATEVGALPDDTVIPSKTSDLTNDSGFITGYTETDPTVPSWAKASSKPTYTAAEVGALPDTTVIPVVEELTDSEIDAAIAAS